MQMWTRNKRALSESDCEDLYHDDHSKDCSSPGEGLNDSCSAGGSGNMTRKRRRGIIEKRRRDRINHSLTELRRLVPSAYEKQGSAKLEKAEILQLTVDHLKMLHAKGLDSLAYDPHKFAMDYHNIGFRECAAEVARYLVSVEGLDVQDPMRLRLMSHLQCFAAQRELSNKPVTPGAAAVAAVAPPPTSAPPPVGTPAVSNNSWPFPAYATSNTPANSGHAFNNQQQPTTSGMFDQSTGHHYNMDMNSSFHPANPARLHAPHQPTMTTLQSVHQPGHHVHHPAAPAPYPHVNHHPFPGLTAQNPGYSASGNQVKPYRPWGAELAY